MELTITVQNMQSIRAETSAGQTVFGQVNSSPLHKRLVKVFEHWLGMDQIKRQEDLEVLGNLLFQILFNGEVYRLYEDLRRQASKERRLRLQLSFQGEVFDLAGYPWEFLYAPETETRRGYFMATEQNLVLSRFMPLENERLDDLKSIEGPMTILIVVSSPEDQPHVIAPPVIEAIQNLAKDQEIRVVIEKLPTVDRFQEVIQDNRPHVLHFLGHGEFDETKQAGRIALLADDEHLARWVPDRLFAEYFTQIEAVPRLVFLHSCEGGANQFSARFAGLAPQLVRNNIQAVIAMQYPIQNKAAILFSKAFYRELLRGAPVDSAAQSGRYAITNDPDYGYDSRVFGTPMLWMRSRSGVILST